MKIETRELLADIKAAARIGRAESLQLALDSLRGLPEVSGNSRLSAAFIDQLILPLGQVLAQARIDPGLLKELGADPLAAVRAVAAAAMAGLFLSSDRVSLEDLSRPGREARSEVRTALAKALASGAPAQPDKVLFLVAFWISPQQRQAEGDTPGARLRVVALQAAAGLAAGRCTEVLPLLENLHTDSDPEVEVALVPLLIVLAKAGFAPQVLDLLERWASSPKPNTWVIASALASAWAADHLPRANALLDNLETRLGPNRHIANARSALKPDQPGERTGGNA